MTGEDTKKTAMYRAESQRKAEMSAATSVEDFLKKLEKGKLGIASWVQPEKVASDHRPVFVVISKSDSFVSDVVGE